ncbi:hypothetical protein [Rhodoferax sp.]|jgi:hypothetical protein|uniref:hypothetical protein n=1 Tax=Rhodoferax sp. TaxID=50421 RepID=UPI0037846C59
MSPVMNEWLIRLGFAVAGLIHLIPLVGLLGRSALERGYGVDLGQGNDLTILMQHRALLFGLLAAACFAAVLHPSWRTAVGTAALVSMLGFVLIAALQTHGAPIAKVMWVDLGAAVLLGLCMLLHAKTGQSD